jgi:hypothetical protein
MMKESIHQILPLVMRLILNNNETPLDMNK